MRKMLYLGCTGLRSLLFYLVMLLSIPIFCTLQFLSAPFLSKRAHRWFTMSWNYFILAWLYLSCGLRHRVEGLENLPAKPCVVLSKHQSAWETLFLQTLFHPLSTVMKQELLRIPFFGHGLLWTRPIGISRKSSAATGAARRVLEQGRERLAAGNHVLIFPERGRTHIGEQRVYARGGATLAVAAEANLVPIAHNSGLFWPRRSFLKYPGVITIVIGPPLHTRGGDPRQLTAQAQEWIEKTVAGLVSKTPNPAHRHQK